MVKLRKITPKNKKAVSAIIGYVLLITFGIIMSAIVYNYLKTYVPKDLLECPEGTSVFVKDYSCSEGILNLTIKNNGRFNLAGYYIHYTNNSAQKIATLSLASSFQSDGVSMAQGNTYIVYNFTGVSPETNGNTLTAGTEFTHSFNYTQEPAFIEITPVRYESYEDKIRFASCGNVRVKEFLECS